MSWLRCSCSRCNSCSSWPWSGAAVAVSPLARPWASSLASLFISRGHMPSLKIWQTNAVMRNEEKLRSSYPARSRPMCLSQYGPLMLLLHIHFKLPLVRFHLLFLGHVTCNIQTMHRKGSQGMCPFCAKRHNTRRKTKACRRPSLLLSFHLIDPHLLLHARSAQAGQARRAHTCGLGLGPRIGPRGVSNSCCGRSSQKKECVETRIAQLAHLTPPYLTRSSVGDLGL